MVSAVVDGESGGLSSVQSWGSKTTSGTPLWMEEKELVKQMYTSQLKYPKWQLATEKIVEDTMYQFVQQCSYEQWVLIFIDCVSYRSIH